MSKETNEIQVQEAEKQVAETEAERTRDRPTFVPRADIYENEAAIVVVADMPGVDQDSIDITLEKNTLTISGTVEPAPRDDYSLSHAEYRVGDYTRSFSLTNEIDRDAIEATLKYGVLRLRMPKVTAAQARKIAVQAG